METYKSAWGRIAHIHPGEESCIGLLTPRLQAEEAGDKDNPDQGNVAYV